MESRISGKTRALSLCDVMVVLLEYSRLWVKWILKKKIQLSLLGDVKHDFAVICSFYSASGSEYPELDITHLKNLMGRLEYSDVR